MSSSEIKTFGELLTNGKSTGELADLVEDQGVYWLDGPGRWKADPMKKDLSDHHNRAIAALSEHYHIHNHGTQVEAEEYWKIPDNQAVDRFGFKEVDGELTVEQSTDRTQSAPEEKSKVDELRAVAVHVWLQCGHSLPTRVELWKSMNEIDPRRFQPKHTPTGKQTPAQAAKNTKNAVDRLNVAYERLYGNRLNFSE